MQYSPQYYVTGPPNCPQQICPQFQPSYSSPCPDIIGEGEVTSIVLPDGTIQLYFLPTSKWNPYIQNPNLINCNPYWNPSCGAWFIKSIPNWPPPCSPFVQPQPCNFPSLNSPVTSPQPPTFQVKFHNDCCTSTTDIFYFCPRVCTNNFTAQSSANVQDKCCCIEVVDNRCSCGHSSRTNGKSRDSSCAEDTQYESAMSIDESTSRSSKTRDSEYDYNSDDCCTSKRKSKQGKKNKRRRSRSTDRCSTECACERDKSKSRHKKSKSEDRKAKKCQEKAHRKFEEKERRKQNAEKQKLERESQRIERKRSSSNLESDYSCSCCSGSRSSFMSEPTAGTSRLHHEDRRLKHAHKQLEREQMRHERVIKRLQQKELEALEQHKKKGDHSHCPSADIEHPKEKKSAYNDELLEKFAKEHERYELVLQDLHEKHDDIKTPVAKGDGKAFVCSAQKQFDEERKIHEQNISELHNEQKKRESILTTEPVPKCNENLSLGYEAKPKMFQEKELGQHETKQCKQTDTLISGQTEQGNTRNCSQRKTQPLKRCCFVDSKSQLQNKRLNCIKNGQLEEPENIPMNENRFRNQVEVQPSTRCCATVTSLEQLRKETDQLIGEAEEIMQTKGTCMNRGHMSLSCCCSPADLSATSIMTMIENQLKVEQKRLEQELKQLIKEGQSTHNQNQNKVAKKSEDNKKQRQQQRNEIGPSRKNAINSQCTPKRNSVDSKKISKNSLNSQDVPTKNSVNNPDISKNNSVHTPNISKRNSLNSENAVTCRKDNSVSNQDNNTVHSQNLSNRNSSNSENVLTNSSVNNQNILKENSVNSQVEQNKSSLNSENVVTCRKDISVSSRHDVSNVNPVQSQNLSNRNSSNSENVLTNSSVNNQNILIENSVNSQVEQNKSSLNRQDLCDEKSSVSQDGKSVPMSITGNTSQSEELPIYCKAINAIKNLLGGSNTDPESATPMLDHCDCLICKGAPLYEIVDFTRDKSSECRAPPAADKVVATELCENCCDMTTSRICLSCESHTGQPCHKQLELQDSVEICTQVLVDESLQHEYRACSTDCCITCTPCKKAGL